MIVIGVDIGLQGALAFLDASTKVLLDVVDMPVDHVMVGKAERGRVSDARLLSLLADYGGASAYLERPEGRPLRGRDRATGAQTLRQPGAAGMLAFGEGYGIVRCACIANGIAITEIRPGAWKREMGVSGDKDEARRRAGETFPAWRTSFARKKDDGRAESALLALWGARKTT